MPVFASGAVLLTRYLIGLGLFLSLRCFTSHLGNLFNACFNGELAILDTIPRALLGFPPSAKDVPN